MTTDHILNAKSGIFGFGGSPTFGELTALYTGRNISLSSGRYQEAEQWISCYESSQFENTQLEGELLASLQLVKHWPSNLPIFRGRWIEGAPTSWEEFGPPPSSRAGRYNLEGLSTLYLCESKIAVGRELNCGRPGQKLWIQQYNVPEMLRILDARSLATDSFAAAIFWLIERERETHCLLGQRIGKLISENFDGLCVPGVRGVKNETYWNIVVFNANDRWRDWVAKGVQPEAVG